MNKNNIRIILKVIILMLFELKKQRPVKKAIS